MPETIKVGVIGAKGRMGATVCDAVSAAPDLELVAAVDVGDDLPGAFGPEGRTLSPDDRTLSPADRPLSPADRSLSPADRPLSPADRSLSPADRPLSPADRPLSPSKGAAGVEVAVDFTTPDAVLDNVRACVDLGIHVVVGTSGFTPERLDEVRALLGDHPEVGVLVAPNFGIGAVLMMQFARKAAPFFESVEIVEMHHPDKVDAPSGTARQTASLVGGARERSGLANPDATQPASRVPRGETIAGVPVHAVRLRGLVAHQEVLFGSPGEVLTIRHDSLDRASFMPGVLMAIRAVGSRLGLTVGIDDLLEART